MGWVQVVFLGSGYTLGSWLGRPAPAVQRRSPPCTAGLQQRQSFRWRLAPLRVLWGASHTCAGPPPPIHFSCSIEHECSTF